MAEILLSLTGWDLLIIALATVLTGFGAAYAVAYVAMKWWFGLWR